MHGTGGASRGATGRLEPCLGSEDHLGEFSIDGGDARNLSVRVESAPLFVELAWDGEPPHPPSPPPTVAMPADFSKLSGFVGNLTEAKLQRLVTSNAERIARLEFKDTKIELLDNGGKVLFTVTLGKNPETGGGRFVRFGDEPKAFLASLNAWLDTEPKNWANTELLNLKADDIAKIEIPFAEGGPVTLSRAKKEDAWTADKTPAGQKVKADKVSTVLSSLGSIRSMSSIAAPTCMRVARANGIAR